jgi:hypothetical protein
MVGDSASSNQENPLPIPKHFLEHRRGYKPSRNCLNYYDYSKVCLLSAKAVQDRDKDDAAMVKPLFPPASLFRTA